jgi:AcrR family transcriptional regulator
MRESLLSAAENLLLNEGWKGTTMERLAHTVGIAKGTVYNYFRDKRELLWAVVERNTENLRHLVASLDAEKGDPVVLLTRGLEGVLSGFHRARHVIAALIQAYHEDRQLDASCTAGRSHLIEVRTFIRKSYAGARRMGVFRPIDPTLGEAWSTQSSWGWRNSSSSTGWTSRGGIRGDRENSFAAKGSASCENLSSGKSPP